MKSKMFLLFGIPAGMLVAWFLFSPLFIDQQVEESLPGAESTGTERISIDELAASATEMADIMAFAAAKPDAAVTEAMPKTMPTIESPTALTAGTFSDADEIHKGSGRAAIYALPNGKKLLRFEEFRVTNGPDLVVYLARHPDPKNADDVKAGFTKLASLKGNVGSQNYEIPADIKLDDYASAVIWCELFGVLFSAAPLSVP